MSRLMMIEILSVASHLLEWTLLLCLYQWAPTRSCYQGNRGSVPLSCLSPPNPWRQQSYCILWGNFEVKNSSFLFFTSLLLSLQFYLTYKLCTVCPLEIVWFLSFMLSKCCFFLHCFRSLCMVYDSQCYLWGFDLLPYSLKSSQSIYVFCFAQNHVFLQTQSNLVLKTSPFRKSSTSHIAFSTFSDEQTNSTKRIFRTWFFSFLYFK